ncbi:MAG TPA: hypothetical protein DDY78_25045 [Planctomycetales bacterium]|nr:hypothetical protein [Planctomycetales bacterium]
MGGVTFAPGKSGQAFSFPGGSAYVKLPDNLFPFPTSGNANTPFAFDTWFQTTTGGVILGQQNGSPFGGTAGYVPSVSVDAAGILRVEMFWKGSVDPITSTSRVNDGLFHHVAVTYDGSTETVYLDGAAVGSRSGYSQVAYASSYQYQLGTGYTAGWPGGNGGWYSFQGLIDETAIYNRALTAAEVQSLYLAGGTSKIATVVQGNIVQGNRIGTDVTGSVALGNAGNGVNVQGGANNMIGGAAPGAGNFISGNAGSGVAITGSTATGNVVAGSFIGTDGTGAAALANGGNGVTVSNGAQNNTIGGNAPGVQSVVTAGGLLTDVYGVAVAADGQLIVADPFNKQLVRVNPLTGAQTVVSSHDKFASPDGIALAANGDIYVADSGFHGTPAIIRVNPTTGAQTVISTGQFFVSPGDLVFGRDGDLYVADFAADGGAGAIIRVDPTTGNQTVLTQGPGPELPQDMALAADGSLWVVYDTQNGGAGEVDRVDTTTGARTVLTTGGLLVNPLGIVVAPDGSLLVTNISAPYPSPGNIIRIDPTTGAQTLAYSGGLVTVPYEMAFAPNGDLYVTNYANDVNQTAEIVRIAANAARNVISGNAGDGVLISGAGTMGNVVQGNYIGTNALGVAALTNGSSGVTVSNGAGGNTIGGTAPGAGNIISGNVQGGVEVVGHGLLTGLVSYYGMDSIVADSLGNNSPTDTSGVSFVPGHTGEGVNLGSAGHIAIADNGSLDNQTFTLAAWANPDGTGAMDWSGNAIIEKNTANGNISTKIGYSPLTHHFCVGVIDYSANHDVFSNDTFAPGSFYHVAATYDGTTLSLYVNGVLEGQAVIGAAISYDPSVPWTIGTNAYFTRRWQGTLDDIAIYNRALSASDIQVEMNATDPS